MINQGLNNSFYIFVKEGNTLQSVVDGRQQIYILPCFELDYANQSRYKVQFILYENAIRILTSHIHNNLLVSVDLCSTPAKHLLRKQPCDVIKLFKFAFAGSMNFFYYEVRGVAEFVRAPDSNSGVSDQQSVGSNPHLDTCVLISKTLHHHCPSKRTLSRGSRVLGSVVRVKEPTTLS